MVLNSDLKKHIFLNQIYALEKKVNLQVKQYNLLLKNAHRLDLKLLSSGFI